MELGAGSGFAWPVFGVAAFLALLGAATVASATRNLMRSALGTVLFFGGLAILCAQLGAGFVAALQLLFGLGLVVVASVFGGGAVALRGEPIARASRFRTLCLVVLGAALAGGVLGVTLAIGESLSLMAPAPAPVAGEAPLSLARALFEQGSGALLLMGLLLMTGLVAGLALVREVE